MTHGGKRPGAGRPNGTPNRASAKRQEQVAASGITPLDVMIRTMRELYYTARRKTGVERTQLLQAAASEARGAAPFVHPRLANVNLSGKVDTSSDDAGDPYSLKDFRRARDQEGAGEDEDEIQTPAKDRIH